MFDTLNNQEAIAYTHMPHMQENNKTTYARKQQNQKQAH